MHIFSFWFLLNMISGTGLDVPPPKSRVRQLSPEPQGMVLFFCDDQNEFFQYQICINISFQEQFAPGPHKHLQI